MFVSQTQAVAVARALASKFSNIPGRPDSKLDTIKTVTVHDGGNAAHGFVCEQESARRSRIVSAPFDTAAEMATRKTLVADAKTAVGAANDDKIALVDARLSLAVAEASLVVAQAQTKAAEAVARADTEALATERAAVAAQAQAEASRAAVDSVEADQQANVDKLSAEQADAIDQARKKHQEDYHTVKRAEIIKQSDAV